MTYNLLDRSQERRAPIELYEFIYGASEDMVYRYTNAETNQTAAGKTYTAVPIKRDAIKTNGKFDKTEIQVSLPIDTPLSDMFLPYPPPSVVRLYVRQMHRTDTDLEAPIVWYGRIVSSGRQGREAQLTCNNAILSWKRPGLNRKWQPGCPLLLYGHLCRADPDLFRVNFPVEDIAEDGTLIFPAGWHGLWAPEKFIRGTIGWTSQYGQEARTILKASANSVTFTGFIRDIEVGTELTLWLGCRHDMDDCRQTFDNIANYGGQPWIPFKNPIKQHPFW